VDRVEIMSFDRLGCTSCIAALLLGDVFCCGA
jgi:hypothetical protein